MEMNINNVDLQEAWTRKNEKAIKRHDIQQVCEEVFSAATTFYLQYYLSSIKLKKTFKNKVSGVENCSTGDFPHCFAYLVDICFPAA